MKISVSIRRALSLDSLKPGTEAARRLQHVVFSVGSVSVSHARRNWYLDHNGGFVNDVECLSWYDVRTGGLVSDVVSLSWYEVHNGGFVNDVVHQS